MDELDLIVSEINSTFSNWSAETPISTLREGWDNLFSATSDSLPVKYNRVQFGSVSGEQYQPSGVSLTGPAIIYLHGGGYVLGSVKSHRNLCARLAIAAEANVLSIDYRLAPESPFPAGLNDVVTVYRSLLNRGYSPSSLAIAGDSAGGGLALATLLKLKEASDPLPSCCAVMSPWVDLELTGETMISNASVDPIVNEEMLKTMISLYAPNENLCNPLLSPLQGDYAGLPPLYVQVGENETLADDAIRVVERAKKAGVEANIQIWEKQIHVFQIFASRLIEGQKALVDLGEFIKSKIN